jgi:DNA mismatch repair protein MutS2
MNEHALQALEFPRALEAVARHATTELGAELVRGLRPRTEPEAVDRELARVDQMVGVLAHRESWAPPALPDLRRAIRALAVPGTVWSGADLAAAAVLLHSAREARRALLPLRDRFPLVAELVEGCWSAPDLERRLREAVDERGEVRDGASPELRRVRGAVREARAAIVELLERILAELPDRAVVADASVTVRNGRYCIPIRREARGQVGGIVHDESASRATLFVEPPEAIEPMNRLRELELAEAREVARILAELTELLRPHADALAATLHALAELDALYARARYALRWRASRPRLVARHEAGYRVVEGVHPLLLETGQRVVPFDLLLHPGEHTVVVTGPNAGGKTVLLKAVGLLSCLAQSGVLPPVGHGTELPVFREIFADIGDEQSLEASLSTFTAHLRNLKEILEGATSESLVLIDEIGGATDPVEGAALASAVLRALTRRGAMTLATSHLGALKSLAVRTPGIVNASLAFDAERMEPLYRLVKGVPGRSYGLAIARRVGFPEDVLREAERGLPEQDRDLALLLEELEAKRVELDATLRETQRLRRELEAMQAALEAHRAALRERERELERDARTRARRYLLEARRDVERWIEELRAKSEVTEDDARETRRRLEDAIREQADALRALDADTPAPPAPFAPGDWVRAPALGWSGRVTELRNGTAVVERRGVRISIPVQALEPASPEEEPAPAESGGTRWPELEASSEVDLRGCTVEEALVRLAAALDAATAAGLGEVRIIHGKGTGALRSAVREVLAREPRVKRFRAGAFWEGGTGVTVVELE